MTSYWGIPAPNLEKVHDIPVLGGVTSATQNLATGVVGESMSLTKTLTAGFVAFHGASDKELADKFKEIDTDKSGKLDKNEVGNCLRALKMKEVDIKRVRDEMGDKKIDLEGFKSLVRAN